MAKSIINFSSRCVTFYDFAPDQSPHDLHAFLRKLHDSLNEPLDVTINEDSLELRLERAPRCWQLINALKNGEVRPSYDGTYIRFSKSTPPN